MNDGSLSVSFNTGSWFLSGALPLEIRDAHNHLVTRARGRAQVDVPAGLYIVEATMPGGTRHSEVVEVVADTSTSVVLSAADAVPVARTLWAAHDPWVEEEAAYFEPGEEDEVGYFDIAEERAAIPSAELLDTTGCVLSARESTGWLFEPSEGLDAVPLATFIVDGNVVSASLPLNPAGSKRDERAAVARFTWTGGQGRVDVGFVRERRVAWTLEGLVNSGDTLSTEELFRNADQLLLRKYSDPAAAALGGLTLLRMDRLEDRTGWVENLARDFTWLVDGLVLRAALLSKADNQKRRNEGLDLLLMTAGRRPMFSDGLALMLRLLRGWPDGTAPEARRAAVATVPVDATAVDWNAMALTNYRDP